MYKNTAYLDEWNKYRKIGTRTIIKPFKIKQKYLTMVEAENHFYYINNINYVFFFV